MTCSTGHVKAWTERLIPDAKNTKPVGTQPLNNQHGAKASFMDYLRGSKKWTGLGNEGKAAARLQELPQLLGGVLCMHATPHAAAALPEELAQLCRV